MVLVKILKRKDASSVLVAILLAMIIIQPLTTMTLRPASIISGLHGSQYAGYYGGPGGGWQAEYLYPIVSVVVQIVVLEILAWIVILGARMFKRKK